MYRTHLLPLLVLGSIAAATAPARAQGLEGPSRLDSALDSAIGRLATVAERDYLLPVGFGARIDLLLATVDSTVEYERFGESGNQIELDDEVPYDDDVLAVQLSAWVRIATHAVIEGSYLRLASEDQGRTENAFIHDNTGFSLGDRVEVDYRLQMARLGVRILASVEREATLGVPVGLLWTGQDLSVAHLPLSAGGTGAGRGSARVDAWSPYLGVHGEGIFWDEAGELGYEAQALVFAYPGFSYLDLSAYLTYGFRDFVRMYLGPRVIFHGLERENDDEQDRVSDFELYSLVFGVSVGF